MEILAIIPARGGSKSIPKKNIYPILGKPLIAYSIETAKKSKLITRTIVTTDSKKIAEVAKKFGAEVPFIRPEEYAQDNTPDLPVFQHALRWLKENENYQPDLVVHLWPTSPFRQDGDIDKAIQILINDNNADSVRSVTTPDQVPFKMWRGDSNPYLQPLLKKEYPDFYDNHPEPHTLPRQILPKTLEQTGYLSVIRYKTIMEKNSMQGANILPFIHDQSFYTELDSIKDLKHTEYIMEKYYNK